MSFDTLAEKKAGMDGKNLVYLWVFKDLTDISELENLCTL
jgi:hypothetical protein